MVNISKHNRTLNLKNEIIEMGDSFHNSFLFLVINKYSIESG